MYHFVGIILFAEGWGGGLVFMDIYKFNRLYMMPLSHQIIAGHLTS